MIFLNANLEGEQQLQRILGTVDMNLSDFRYPLQRSQEQLFMTTRTNFSARGSLMGGWQPRKRMYRHPILDKTGTMKNNFEGKVTSTRMEIWNPTKYFKYHQSNSPRHVLPRRVMLKIVQADKTKVSKFFQEYVADSLKGRRY